MRPRILMLGTDPGGKGGIASVIRIYQQSGLFAKHGIRYIATHCDGGAGAKAWRAATAYLRFLLALALRPRLIHVHVASRASFWRKSPFFVLAFLSGTAAILHLHGAEFHLFYANECRPWQQRFIRMVFRRCARVIVLSDAWRNWALSIAPAARVSALYNPVAVPEPAPGWPGRRPSTALFLGRLGTRKGAYDLVEATSRLAVRHPEFRLLMGGDGELDGVRARARELGVDGNIDLLGWVRGDDKDRLLAEASIYALPSYNEGLPVSLLEAMAAGLPVVTTPVGGIPEAVTDGHEGLLVAPGDVPTLAARLEALLDDPATARRMGEAARDTVVHRFSAAAVIPQLANLYAELGAPAVEPTS